MKLKKGDNVIVLSGNDKGKTGEVLEVIPKFSKLRKEKTNGTFDYVSYDGTYGYVSHKHIEKLTNPYVEVDISDQTLWLYKDGDVKLEADVVTGKKSKYDTRLGCHKIYSKEKNRYLTVQNTNSYKKKQMILILLITMMIQRI